MRSSQPRQFQRTDRQLIQTPFYCQHNRLTYDADIEVLCETNNGALLISSTYEEIQIHLQTIRNGRIHQQARVLAVAGTNQHQNLLYINPSSVSHTLTAVDRGNLQTSQTALPSSLRSIISLDQNRLFAIRHGSVVGCQQETGHTSALTPGNCWNWLTRLNDSTLFARGIQDRLNYFCSLLDVETGRILQTYNDLYLGHQ